jgi:hypothetical protein
MQKPYFYNMAIGLSMIGGSFPELQTENKRTTERLLTKGDPLLIKAYHGNLTRQDKVRLERMGRADLCKEHSRLAWRRAVDNNPDMKREIFGH